MAYIGKSPTGSAVRSRYYYTATGGETSLSGADDNGKTLKFTDGEYVDVHLNGVMLVQGTDYGVGTANTISSLSALAANDIVEIIVYDVYNVAKINSEAMRNRWYFTATGGETSIGTSQISGLTFPANAEIDVKLNGVTLQAGTDYNTTTANTVGGLSALTAGQVVEIVYYEKFVLADTVSKAAGGTFGGDVTFSNDVTVSNDLTVSGDLDVTGNIKTGNPSFKVYLDTNITSFDHTSTGDVVVIYNSDSGEHDAHNTGSHYSTTTGKFTAPVAGVYFFHGSVYSSTDTYGQCWFVKNGSRAAGTDFGGLSSSFQQAITILKLSANDTVGFHPYKSTGTSTINSNDNHTYFTGCLLYQV
jgi:hypothetical protein